MTAYMDTLDRQAEREGTAICKARLYTSAFMHARSMRGSNQRQIVCEIEHALEDWLEGLTHSSLVLQGRIHLSKNLQAS